MNASENKNDLCIRPYQPGDDVFALILPIQQQEFAVAVTKADQPDLADIDGFYRRGAGEFWVAAEADGRIVGSIALIDVAEPNGGANGRIGVVRKMFVAADRRGGREVGGGREAGLAQRLFDTLAEHAAARGIGDLWLGTTEKFLAAHRFYERNGFAVVDAADLPAAFPRMAVDSRFYHKQITSA